MLAMYDLDGRPLRVLFLGNDDNLNYQAAKWSREFGVEADLWIIQPIDPYRGDIRLLEPDLDELPNWVKNVALGDGRRMALFPGEIGRTIDRTYDFVSVTGPASLMSSRGLRAPRGLQCTGGELGDLPFPFKPGYSLSQGHRPLRYNVSVALFVRAALRRLDFIIDSFEEHTSALRRLGLLDKRKFLGLPADCSGSRNRVRADLRKELMERYGKARRVFMWFSRLNFSDSQALIYKGAERYLKALENVMPELQRNEVRIVMGRHGNEVEGFLELVDRSPVKSFIEWVPHLGAHELSTYLSLPNAVLFAEFGEISRELSGIGRDAAALGTVTVSSARPDVIERQYGRPAPILRAVTTGDIAQRMRELVDMEERRFTELQQETSEFGALAVDYHSYIPKFYACVQEAIAKVRRR
jgi:hypothetical protein